MIGVIENPPANSRLSYEILMHDSNLEILFPEQMRSHWYLSFGDGCDFHSGKLMPEESMASGF